MAREERDPDEEPAALLQHRDGAASSPDSSPASTRSARSSPSSRGVFGLSFARTSGCRPAPGFTPPPPRLRPLGVKYCPAVMSRAPPLRSSMTSWKTPLPKVRVPTIFARPRSCSAPATISDADAVSRSTSTTSGVDFAIGSPVAFRVCEATPRPAQRHDLAVGQERARDELRLLDQAAAVAAQVEHDPVGALLHAPLDRVVDLRVRTRGRERGKRDHGELLAADRAQRRGDDGHRDRCARERDVARLAAMDTVILTSDPGRALDERRSSSPKACPSASLAHGDDQVARLQARAPAGDSS